MSDTAPPPRGRRAVRPRRSRGGLPPTARLRVAALLLGGCLLSALAGAGAYFLPVFQLAVTQSSGGEVSTPAYATMPGAPAGPMTILLLGSDDDSKFPADRILTQSMILIRVDPAASSVTMLSIPRDLWVPLSTGHQAKIDVAYSEGGARAAIQTVERNFQVHVDHYVWIGLKGLIHLIDSVGGIDVITSNPVLDDFYPADIGTANPYSYSRVAVLPGAQHLGGARALEYVRSRHSDLRGDFGRSQRQQQVLLALRSKTGRLKPADIPTLASALQGEMKTSLGADQVRQLLPVAGRLAPEQIHQVVLLPPLTNPASRAGQDVLLPDWSLIRPVVRQSFPAG